jgi:hypothetical protein
VSAVEVTVTEFVFLSPRIALFASMARDPDGLCGARESHLGALGLDSALVAVGLLARVSKKMMQG